MLKYSIWVNVTFPAVVKKSPVQAQSLSTSMNNKSNKIHLLFCTAHRGQLWPPVVQTTHHTADSATLHHHTLSSWYYPDDWKDAWEHMQIIISTGTQTWHRFDTKKLFISVSIWSEHHWCDSVQQRQRFSISPNPLLLHGLHHSCTS